MYSHGKDINVEKKTKSFNVYELFKMIHYKDTNFLESLKF